ncbi:DNA-binding response regulator, LytR/AlgR family [Parapedobacter composti]|uniref:DNA-binding response regulator, LytR/AlgR family n=1 Tax=Parapedobacter composti TaxID=623281 RepID=A0A1I1HK61_9SPHI|nr:response regulator [Parapedobacter composti]SFC22338.1 DNA-binding response regulator, LytR/AlgR family [Parapedobacter composti]
MEKVKILVIEDEAIVAKDIVARLELADYTITGVADNGEDAFLNYLQVKPDIIMADIHLKGEMDGIQTVERITQLGPIPVIYLTAYADGRTWERAKQTRPAAYLTKPFRERDIHSAIELALDRYREAVGNREINATNHFFIRTENGRFEKLLLEDLLYLEADRSYCHVYTRQRRVLISESLNKLHEKFCHDNLIRIHRSYVINKTAVEAIDHNTVIINGAVLPIGQSYEMEFFSKIHFIR